MALALVRRTNRAQEKVYRFAVASLAHEAAHQLVNSAMKRVASERVRQLAHFGEGFGWAHQSFSLTSLEAVVLSEESGALRPSRFQVQVS